MLIGLLIVFAWAVPATLAGGREYGEAIFWRQSAGRVVKSFAHEQPFWWYLPIIPLLLFPWSVTWPAWRNLRTVWSEQPVRLCLFWTVSSCVMFSLLSGKQIHYLLPVIPFGALLMARLLSTISAHSVQRLTRVVAVFYVMLATGILAVPLLAHQIVEIRPLVPMTPGWIALSLLVALALAVSQVTDVKVMIRRVTFAAILVWSVINGTVFPCIREHVDIGPFATEVGRHQRTTPEVAFVGKYHGQFDFLGRLRSPIHELSSAEQLPAWISEHPHGLVIMQRATRDPLGPGLLAYFGEPSDDGAHRLELWEARSVTVHPEGLAKLNVANREGPSRSTSH